MMAVRKTPYGGYVGPPNKRPRLTQTALTTAWVNPLSLTLESPAPRGWAEQSKWYVVNGLSPEQQVCYESTLDGWTLQERWREEALHERELDVWDCEFTSKSAAQRLRLLGLLF